MSTLTTRRVYVKKEDTKKIVDSRRKVRSPGTSISDASTTCEWVDVLNPVVQKPEFVCTFCQKKFYRYSHLTRHTRDNCLNNPASKCNIGERSKPHICQTCGRRYKERKGLNYHVKHECERTVTCDICKNTMVGAVVPERHLQMCRRRNARSRNWKKEDENLKKEDIYGNISFSDDETE
ncbi:hypothetical protein ANTRET_LOCUS5577 [Anthophora retusa]